MENLDLTNEYGFVDVKNDFGQEYWSSRELAKILDYKDYRNFLVAVNKATEACNNSGYEISLHFGEATNMPSK